MQGASTPAEPIRYTALPYSAAPQYVTRESIET